MQVPNFKGFFQQHPTITKIIVVVILVAVAFTVGRYSKADKVVTQVQTVTQEKVVTKVETQYVEKKVYVKNEQKNVKTTTDVVKKPDGTVETKTTTVDLTKTTDTDQEQASSTLVDNTKEDLQQNQKSTTTVINNQENYHLTLHVGAGALFTPGLKTSLNPRFDAGIQLERRLLGPVFLGIYGSVQTGFVPFGSPPYTVIGGLTVGLAL